MATPKVITAADIEQGRLTLIRSGSTLHLERRYVFLDTSGSIINDLTGKRILEEMAVIDIPSSIASALVAIDNWTYSKALVQEGMED